MMYPAYGGANQLWTWEPNDTLVSKMGLVADISGVNRATGAKYIWLFSKWWCQPKKGSVEIAR